MSIINVVSGAGPPVGTQPTSAVNPAKANQGTLAATKTPPPPPKHDIVHLSAQAQAKALKQQGETPVQIAASMNTDIKTVDGYLGITGSTVATVTTPPAASTSATGKVDVKV